MNLALLAALGAATLSPPSHLRFPPAARPVGAAVSPAVGTPGYGHPRPARPRGDAFSPGLFDSEPRIVAPPFRFTPDAEPPPYLDALFLGQSRAYRVRVVVTVTFELHINPCGNV